MNQRKEKKIGFSFKENREHLLSRLRAQAGSDAVEKTIPFQNVDVPTFLEKLKDFDSKSREVVLTVK